jgi:hypothetical protein
MLFSKLKLKPKAEEEILPPPPPFPSMELEDNIPEGKPETRPKPASEDDFEDLFREVESLKEAKPKLPKIKAPKKEKKAVKEIREKPKKIEVPVAGKEKPVKIKPLKLSKKLPQIRIKAAKPIKTAEPEAEEFKLGAEEPKTEEIGLPEIEEPLEFEQNVGKIEGRPKEIQEAEEEIKSAIEKIREKEKPSFFKKLFGKKQAEVIERPADDVSAIKSYIENTRNSLMNFDLAAAKRNYIEIIKIYNMLGPEEQAKVYQDIKDLYSERKSAEELKV